MKSATCTYTTPRSSRAEHSLPGHEAPALGTRALRKDVSFCIAINSLKLN